MSLNRYKEKLRVCIGKIVFVNCIVGVLLFVGSRDASALTYYFDSEIDHLSFPINSLITSPPDMTGHGLNVMLYHEDYTSYPTWFRAQTTVDDDLYVNTFVFNCYLSAWGESMSDNPSKPRMVYAQIILNPDTSTYLDPEIGDVLSSVSFEVNSSETQFFTETVSGDTVIIPKGSMIELRMWSDIMSGDDDWVSMETEENQYTSIELLSEESIGQTPMKFNPALMLLLKNR